MPASPTSVNSDAAKQMVGCMSRIYLMYKTDLNAGNITNPEWYDDVTWKQRLLLFYNRYKNYTNGLASEGFYGYEMLMSETCWTYLPLIEAE